MSEKYLSVLKMIKLVFDELSFQRHGFINDNKPSIKIDVQIGEDKNQNLHIVSVIATVAKAGEYTLSVKLSGFFELDEPDEQIKKELLTKNAVAILMPYMRSEICLLTAQPETESLVLPVLNIAELAEEDTASVI